MRSKTFLTACLFVSGSLAVFPSCSNYSEGGGDKTAAQSLDSQAQETIKTFKEKDPSSKKFFDNAYGYAVFPTIAKGAAGIGAANGAGAVYGQGHQVGTSDMTQVTVGLQLGGQSYSEFIFFQDKAHLDQFRGGHTEFSANASAVAVTAGAAAANDFKDGLAVFTMPHGGLMFEASIGGQKFSYKPLK